jgi:hypothetical protein
LLMLFLRCVMVAWKRSFIFQVLAQPIG